jgi:23S rRNA pseudouridine1911/1915/1917 synthase
MSFVSALGRPGVPEAHVRGQESTAAQVCVLYEDDELLAVDKPAGMVVHPAYRHPTDTLFDAVVARQVERGERRPWLLHRLDRDTSGVVLLAKTERARRSLVRQFERRDVRKVYLAVVRGAPAAAAGEISQPLRRDLQDRRRVVVDSLGQGASTAYRVIAQHEGAALLLAEPRTGRTHQIRAHLAWLGHPIVGDATYAAEQNAADAPARPGGDASYGRHLLHAWQLRIAHPVSGAPLRIVAPLPRDMTSALPRAWRALCSPDEVESM